MKAKKQEGVLHKRYQRMKIRSEVVECGIVEYLKRPMNDPVFLADAIRKMFGENLAQEIFGIVCFDTKCIISAVYEVAVGTKHNCLVEPREIFQRVLESNSYSFAIFHYHTTGDPSPSEADKKFTSQLIRACEIMKIKMLDHIIMCCEDGTKRREDHFSFMEHGLLAAMI